jgi:uncharacterized protein (DUF302 family)
LKQIYTLLILFLVSTLFNGCTNTPQKDIKTVTTQQDVQVYTSSNTNGTITPKSIEKSFESSGLSIVGNNNMNKPFQARFGKTHYSSYNLAMYINNDLTFKLIKKYPAFGALTPLTMSIWTQNNSINISTLTIHGMARTAGIPLNDPDLIKYASLIQLALQTAMPNGHFKKLLFKQIHQHKSLQVNFTGNINLDEGENVNDYIDDFEAEFEGELEPLGFLFPNYINVQEEIFDNHNYHEYDFYHTYSICKFDVIYPVSKLHPEAGAWAPCSLYIYKKKGENKIHIGFLSVNNWISTLNIKDQASIKPLKEAQGMIVNILKEMTE